MEQLRKLDFRVAQLVRTMMGNVVPVKGIWSWILDTLNLSGASRYGEKRHISCRILLF